MHLYLNLLWKGGTKHQCLPDARLGHGVLIHDAADLWLKAHVQHTISFIKHKESIILDEKTRFLRILARAQF